MTEKPLSERMLDYCREDDPLRLEIVALEAENQRLKEENAELYRWEVRNIATKKEWGKQLTEAESRLSKAQALAEKWRKDYEVYSAYQACQVEADCADELESALRGGVEAEK